jgi:hypothetical protein
MRPFHALLLAVALVAGGPAACIPYAVGSTAQPLPAGESRTAMTAYRIPRGIDVFGDSGTDSDNAPFVGIDGEWRRGLGDGADVGIRIPSTSGVVFNYKKRIAGGDSLGAPALSVMPGAGVVNWLSHGHFEMTVMGSARRWNGITPYAGARVMQVVPLEPDAVHDTPTAGGYAGFRFGGDGGGLSVELGVYRDRSALGVRKGNVIMVPSITADGDLLEVLRDSGILGGLGGRRRRPRW